MFEYDAINYGRVASDTNVFGAVDRRWPLVGFFVFDELFLHCVCLQKLSAICYYSYKRLLRAAHVLAFHGFLRIEYFYLSVGNNKH